MQLIGRVLKTACRQAFMQITVAPPADSRWRKKLARSGAEKILEESLKTGLREGFIKKSELIRVNVDSTVQEKAVRYPTDA